ncbi:AAA domain-containing protein [Demequina sp. SYSU T00068]|uniref:AAA domain-containing protein n=1 Tax=Demequina lignilytica TaxID=3051663 RepID=UPI00262F20D3|nr:AAA domain-containing protein [Demequina sp. SYSU T00068]MDN4489683.1 AAA domain-containing protein [Demequina sp. SYSU T00068]
MEDSNAASPREEEFATAVGKMYLAATKEWRSALIDVSGNNRLLYFRKTQSMIDLAEARPDGVQKLLTGAAVRLADLFPAGPQFDSAKRACALLERKQRESREEYGVSVAYIAVGLASWDLSASPAMTKAESDDVAEPVARLRDRRPSAPVILRPLELSIRRGAQTSWELRLDEEFQLNGVLQHVINADKVRLPDDDTYGIDDPAPGAVDIALNTIRERCADIADFTIDDEIFLGTFSYMKQTMVNDVDDETAIAVSDIVAALAGDRHASDRARHQAGDISERQPDYEPVASEFLVLDADSSQSYVINAARAGRNMVVEGPPGTGKSQTIANLIASLTADGKRVLFVAQKRAAISAVLDRLDRAGLAHLVLDMFASTGSRRYISAELRRVLDSQHSIGRPDVSSLEFALDAARGQLVGHHDALHRDDHAWGVSVHELRSATAATPEDAKLDVRLPGSLFNSWTATDLDRFCREADDLAAIGALDPEWAADSMWSRNYITGTDQLQWVTETVQRLAGIDIPMIRADAERCARAIGYAPPTTWEQARVAIGQNELYQSLRADAPQLFDPSVSADDLNAMSAALDRGERKRLGIALKWGERRTLKARAATLTPDLDSRARKSVVKSAAAYVSLCRAAGTAPTPPQLHTTTSSVDDTLNGLRLLQAAVPGVTLEALSLDDAIATLSRAAADSRRGQMPRVHAIEQDFHTAGLGVLLDALRREAATRVPRSTPPSTTVRWAVQRAVLEMAEMMSPWLSSSNGTLLNNATAEFRVNDVEHLVANAARIRRVAAERFRDALDRYPEEHQLLKTEVTRKRNFRAVRTLFREAPHVVQAAKPVWAMSPLQVSRVLPLEQCFDVVIFDEASQVRPADAIPALMRASQAIVAGDSRQLPPTEFFTKVLEDDNAREDEDETASLSDSAVAERPQMRSETFTRDAESILFAMDRLLAGQSRRLLWHYRSRDERLIAVSNAGVYDHSLTTFPAADSSDVIRHVTVEPSPGIRKTTNSPELEVAKVVALVRDHATAHPDRTLGVITFGVQHQRRIEDALEAAALSDATLRNLLDQTSDEPFFVKSIERVQGDERDSIILTVGYGKGLDGKLRYFWGPLLQEGGERRLNVAISRARAHMTLVTSFEADDVAPDAHPSAGFRLMVQFLRFMASGGQDIGDLPTKDVALNPFEIDVRDRLTRAGIPLDCQVGVGGYRIDFAARHPDKPGKHVLAIEADGASYHSGHTARERDRLRQSLLEARGWRFVRIWSTDWFRDPDAEVERILTTYREAVDDGTAATDEPPGPIAEPANWSEDTTRATVTKPRLVRGQPITDYSHQDLVALVRYLRSDGVLRTRDDEFLAVMRELGFTRRGTRITTAITAALDDRAGFAAGDSAGRVAHMTARPGAGARKESKPAPSGASERSKATAPQTREVPRRPGAPTTTRDVEVPGTDDLSRAWRTGEAYKLTFDGVVTPLEGGQALTEAVSRNVAVRVLARMRAMRPDGGRFKVDRSGLMVTLVDDEVVFVTRVTRADWFPSHWA